MIFFAGFVLGAAAGCGAFYWFYNVRCANSEVQCNTGQRDMEIQKQLERLISYGNDF